MHHGYCAMWVWRDDLEDVRWEVPNVGYETVSVCKIVVIATREADAAISLAEHTLEVAKEGPFSM